MPLTVGAAAGVVVEGTGAAVLDGAGGLDAEVAGWDGAAATVVGGLGGAGATVVVLVTTTTTGVVEALPGKGAVLLGIVVMVGAGGAVGVAVVVRDVVGICFMPVMTRWGFKTSTGLILLSNELRGSPK